MRLILPAFAALALAVPLPALAGSALEGSWSGGGFVQLGTLAGYDTSLGDLWAINELPSGVRSGAGAAQLRQDVRDFVHGLRTGEPFQTDRLDNLRTLTLMESIYRVAGIPV